MAKNKGISMGFTHEKKNIKKATPLKTSPFMAHENSKVCNKPLKTHENAIKF